MRPDVSLLYFFNSHGMRNCQLVKSVIVFYKSCTRLVVPASCHKRFRRIQLSLYLRNPSNLRYLVPYIFGHGFSNIRHRRRSTLHMARKVTEWAVPVPCIDRVSLHKGIVPWGNRQSPQAQFDWRKSKMASFEKAKKSYQKFHKERGQVRENVMEEYPFWCYMVVLDKVLSLNSAILL